MKKIIALLLVVIMCLAVVGCNSGNNSQNPNDNANSENGGNNSHKDILGDWFSANSKDKYVKFFDDGTGELKDGAIFDFEWEYDSENENYRASVAGRRITFKMRTEEGITFLTGFGFLFREEDCETALAAASVLRENYINRALDGKTLMPLGEQLSIGNATVVFEKIKLSEDKRKILCDVSIVANKDMTSTELNDLMILAKYTYFHFDENYIFNTFTSGGNGTQISLLENSLGAGETLKTEICIIDEYHIPDMLEKWGKYDGYAIIKCGGTEYYINLCEYTKQ